MAKTSDLPPNPRNPRKITDQRLARLRRSMAEFGDLSGMSLRVGAICCHGRGRAVARPKSPDCEGGRAEKSKPQASKEVLALLRGAKHPNAPPSRELYWARSMALRPASPQPG